MGRHGRAPAAQGAPVDPDELRRRGLPPGDRPAATRLPVGDSDADGAGADRGAVLGGPRRPLLPAGRFPARLATGHRAPSPAGSAAPGAAVDGAALDGAAVDAGARYRDLDAAGFRD